VVRWVPAALVEVGEDAEPVDADGGAVDEDGVEPLAGLGRLEIVERRPGAVGVVGERAVSTRMDMLWPVTRPVRAVSR
jgi:hypothetical protein